MRACRVRKVYDMVCGLRYFFGKSRKRLCVDFYHIRKLRWNFAEMRDLVVNFRNNLESLKFLINSAETRMISFIV